MKYLMKECFEALSVDKETSFFISYKWNEISENEVDVICKRLALYQINSIRDRYRLKYGESIMNYMNSLNECDGVILIISKEYFFSINCMYEGITALQNCKNRTIIRMVDSSVFSYEFKSEIAEFWDTFDETGILGTDKEKLKKVCEGYQEFVSWINDTKSVDPDNPEQFLKELEKYISKVFLESFNYSDMVSDLINSKEIVISKVCDPACEESYYYKNIHYSIQESPVEYFKCFYNFVLSLEKCDTKEIVDISINNVVGIEEGNSGINFSKYYFVIPQQKSLERLAFEEKLGKDKSEIEYDKRRLIVNL